MERLRRFGQAAVVMTAFLWMAAPAHAALITDPDSGLVLNTSPALNQIFGQTAINPCVIGPPNCQNPAGWVMEEAGSGGAGSIFDTSLTAPTIAYSIATILGIIGQTNAFTIGIDFNQANIDQTLYSFIATYAISGGTTQTQVFDLTTVLPTNFSGEGFSDFILSGFVIPANTLSITFDARWFNNDGADRFFLRGAAAVPCTSADCPDLDVSEPALLTLLGVGLLGAGFVRRRKQRVGAA